MNASLFDEEEFPCSSEPLCDVPLKTWEFETLKSSEGREFLKLATDVWDEAIDRNYEPLAICIWLEELGYALARRVGLCLERCRLGFIVVARLRRRRIIWIH